jgi:hypothetical protein
MASCCIQLRYTMSGLCPVITLTGSEYVFSDYSIIITPFE